MPKLILVTTGLAVLVLFLVKGPSMMVDTEWRGSAAEPKERAKLIDECRKTLAQIVGGLALLVGLYFTWRNTKATEEGNITDRFSKAVDQLGAADKNDTKYLRFDWAASMLSSGIARDTPRDNWPIIEILTAYVRHNSAWTSLKKKPNADSDFLEVPEPPADIKAIRTLLGRRELKADEASPNLS